MQFGINYTWSKAIIYRRYFWTDDSLNKDVAPGNRPHAVNYNFGYDMPEVRSHVSDNRHPAPDHPGLAPERQRRDVLRHTQ